MESECRCCETHKFQKKVFYGEVMHNAKGYFNYCIIPTKKYVSGAKVEFINNKFWIPYMNYSVKLKKPQHPSKQAKKWKYEKCGIAKKKIRIQVIGITSKYSIAVT